MLDIEVLFKSKELCILVPIISIFIEVGILKGILNELFISKNSKGILNISFLTCILASIMSDFLIKNNVLGLCIYILILIVFTYSNYEVSLLKNIIICVSYLASILVCKEVMLSIFKYISYTSTTTTINMFFFTFHKEEMLYIQSEIFSKLIVIFLIPIIKFFKLRYTLTKKEFNYLAILISGNLIYILCIICIFYMETHNILLLSLDICMTFLTAIVVIINIYSINLISRIIKDREIILQNEAIKKNIAMQYNYYLNIQNTQQDIKKLYHDMKNHMICIENMYTNNDYIENLNKQLDKYNNVFDTGNIILDVILSDKKSICNKLNIKLVVDVNFKKCDFIDVVDVCSIFSNMLDNAIEACEKIIDNKEKYIKLRGTIVNSLYFIKCENSKTNKVNMVKKSIITDKCDKFLHGIGISSIKSSVLKYDGNVEIDYSDYEFIICIYIPIIKNNSQLCS